MNIKEQEIQYWLDAGCDQKEAEKLAARSKKWQTGSRQPANKASVTVDDDWAMSLFAEVPAKAPEYQGPICSFCGTPVDNITAVRGTGKPKVSVITDPVPDGDDIRIEETVRIQAQKVLACKKCAHLIVKPVVVSRV